MTSSFSPAAVLSAPLLAVLNHVLSQADWARQKLQAFAGRGVRIAMPPFSLSFVITAAGGVEASNGSPDLDIVLPSDAPLLAMRGSEQVMKAAQVNGPADLADTLGFVMRNLRWDIEEDLSKAVGDIAARRMMAGFTAFAGWQRQATRNLGENLSEYLVEEKPTLIKTADLTGFSNDVERLRRELATVEARVSRLRR